MTPKRKETQDFFLNTLKELDPKTKNIQMYESYFETLSDKNFEVLMVELRDKKKILPYYTVNLSGKDIDIDRAFKVADKLGINFFQKLIITDPDTGIPYKTTKEYFILKLVVRRQSQHLEKGKSVTVDSKVIDIFTGQPVGDSKTCRLSAPELIVLDSLRLDNCINELLNVKGGNEKAYRESQIQIANTGTWSIAEATKSGSRPTSTTTLKSFLFGMHLQNNL